MFFKSDSSNALDIAPPGATIGKTLSSLPIITSIKTGPFVSKAYLIAGATSSFVETRIALHPNPSATLQKSTLSSKIVLL